MIELQTLQTEHVVNQGGVVPGLLPTREAVNQGGIVKWKDT